MLRLPHPIAAYFQADQGDAVSVSECFTEDAIVKDEGNTYTGRNAIRAWKEKSSGKYKYVAEPFSIDEAGEQTIVTAHVVGDFPGSPVDLRYFFSLHAGKIASLEVKV